MIKPTKFIDRSDTKFLEELTDSLNHSNYFRLKGILEDLIEQLEKKETK